MSSVPPPAITSASFARACSIASFWRANDFSSITAPMKLEKSLTSPILIVPTSSTSRSRSSGQRFAGAYTREAAEHFWPWYSNEPRRIAVASASTSALGWATMKSLPPVSPTMRG